MKAKGTILTGHRTTGPRHLGHLVGTLQTWVRLQDEYRCFFLLADLHTLTTDYAHPETVRANAIDVAIDWLAAGIDPQRSTLMLQSALPQHAELALLLSMLTSVARLERVPTYKEQVQQLNLQPSLGLLTYPVLQAADILLYKADTVPVGGDQLPHLELTREIARRFNQLYGELFHEPQALLSATPRLPGTDNRTMHSSYGNAIYLRDTPEETRRKVMEMYTDPTRIHPTDPGHVEGNPVFDYMDVFNPDRGEVEDLKARYRLGKVGDVAVKQRLSEVLNAYLAPLRQRRTELAAHPQEIVALLMSGTDKARPIAQQTLEDVMEKMGLNLGRQFAASVLGQSPYPISGPFC
ncbi:MAG: tryptophan--tRNA ligase [Chloroflexi bacterium]|nr:tryptophan--tRNA ligase [Chloroflexota bacterium]